MANTILPEHPATILKRDKQHNCIDHYPRHHCEAEGCENASDGAYLCLCEGFPHHQHWMCPDHWMHVGPLQEQRA